MVNITCNFNWQSQEVIPFFLEGESAQELYSQTEGIRTGHMQYDPNTKLVSGSTLFLAARVDTLVRPLGLRVVNLRDLSRPEVMKLIQDKYYTDAPALVVRSETDPNYPKNNRLIRRILDQASRFNPKFPFMVTGFDAVQLEDKEGYGIDIVARDDFQVTEDERLLGKCSCSEFSDVDEQGFPLFDRKGSRTWYARDKGLSGLCLVSSLDANSSVDDLAGSGDGGRVVLISGAATSQKNFEQYLTRLKQEADKQKAEVDTRFSKARRVLLGEE